MTRARVRLDIMIFETQLQKNREKNSEDLRRLMVLLMMMTSQSVGYSKKQKKNRKSVIKIRDTHTMMTS